MPKPSAPLDVRRVRELVRATRFADVRYLETTASTNADAAALLGDPSAHGSTLIAEYQTAGAGRKGRRWYAPAGCALLFTTILPDRIATSALWAVPFWTSLAVARALASHLGVDAQLVWPNDLHAPGGKLGGILSVARIAGDMAYAGCGVGINVHRPAAGTDLDALDVPAVFLDDLVAHVEREDTLAAILTAFDNAWTLLDKPDTVARRWAQHARLAGTRYRYRRDADGTEREGIATGLGPLGALIVRDEHGETALDMADVRIVGRGSVGLPADQQAGLD